MENRQYDLAIKCFKAVIGLDQKNALAYYGVGACYAFDKKPVVDDAVKYLELAIGLDPKSPEAHITLGRVYLMKQEFVKSFNAHKTAFALDPNCGANPESRRRLLGAVAAIRAAGGTFSTEEKAVFRQHALEWLKSDLAAWDKLLAAKADSAEQAYKVLKLLRKVPDFASVRGDQAPARLPQTEREAWHQLWAEVDTLSAKAGKAMKAIK